MGDCSFARWLITRLSSIPFGVFSLFSFEGVICALDGVLADEKLVPGAMAGGFDMLGTWQTPCLML